MGTLKVITFDFPSSLFSSVLLFFLFIYLYFFSLFSYLLLNLHYISLFIQTTIIIKLTWKYYVLQPFTFFDPF